jgi:hypothetical protein
VIVLWQRDHAADVNSNHDGQEIGRKAHLLFPDGAPTDEEPLAARRLLLLSHSQHPR